MRIVKEGVMSEKFRIKRFECDECGCVFDATNSEYRVVRGNMDEILAECSCPCCGIDAYAPYCFTNEGKTYET